MEMSDQLYAPAALPAVHKGSMGLVGGLNVLGTIQIPSPGQESKHETSVVQPVIQSLYRLRCKRRRM